MVQPPIDEAPDGNPYEQFTQNLRVKVYQRWLRVLDNPNAIKILREEFQQVLDQESKLYWCRGCKQWMKTKKVIGWKKCYCPSCFAKRIKAGTYSRWNKRRGKGKV